MPAMKITPLLLGALVQVFLALDDATAAPRVQGYMGSTDFGGPAPSYEQDQRGQNSLAGSPDAHDQSRENSLGSSYNQQKQGASADMTPSEEKKAGGGAGGSQQRQTQGEYSGRGGEEGGESPARAHKQQASDKSEAKGQQSGGQEAGQGQAGLAGLDPLQSVMGLTKGLTSAAIGKVKKLTTKTLGDVDKIASVKLGMVDQVVGKVTKGVEDAVKNSPLNPSKLLGNVNNVVGKVTKGVADTVKNLNPFSAFLGR